MSVQLPPLVSVLQRMSGLFALLHPLACLPAYLPYEAFCIGGGTNLEDFR